MRVLIVEPHASGHHASYLRWLALTAIRHRWSVVIAATARALAHPLLNSIVADFRDVITHEIEDCPGMDAATARSAQLLFREFAYWKTFKRTATEVRAKMSIDAAILPYVDYCFHALAILGSPFQELPWCGISMRLGVRQEVVSTKSRPPLKWRVAKLVLASSTLRALFVINPSVQDVPRNWFTKAALSKLRYLPDPAELEVTGARAESRADLGISDSNVAMLAFGSIDERKGIDSLLNSLASQNGLDDYVVILAGKQSANMQRELRSAVYADLLSKKRLLVIDRFLSAAEQNLVFAAADVVWVGYRNHIYMSGVLALAGRAGLPVVGTVEGEIGRLIANHKFGAAARIDQPGDVGAALREMLDVHTRAQFGKRAQAAFATHTVENFGATVMSAFHPP
jgi:glycosyltransferase involved in cell wall biosynthesis